MSGRLTLRRMRRDEWAAWERHAHDAYAEHLVELAGLTPEAARAKADADYAALWRAGADTPGQHVLVAEVDGTSVGAIWLSERDEREHRPMAWIHEVEVWEPVRGRGHGRAMLLAAEDEARALGLTQIGLNVYTGNDVALGLYRSLGYETLRAHEHGLNLRKRL